MEQDLRCVCIGQGSRAENWRPSILITTRDFKWELGAYKIFPGIQGASSGPSFLEWLPKHFGIIHTRLHNCAWQQEEQKHGLCLISSFQSCGCSSLAGSQELQSVGMWQPLLWAWCPPVEQGTCSTRWGRSWVSQCLQDSESVSPALRRIRKHLKPPGKNAVTFRIVT